MSDVKRSLVLYTDFPKHTELLNDKQFREVVTAACQYTETGSLPDMSKEAALIFSTIKVALDRDGAKWLDIKKKREEAAKKRWDKEKPNANASN